MKGPLSVVVVVVIGSGVEFGKATRLMMIKSYIKVIRMGATHLLKLPEAKIVLYITMLYS